jgi:GDPmannose 4,6-dehydratase
MDLKKHTLGLKKIIDKGVSVASSKIALITGITGQDGSYLAEYLLEKGYVVHGIKRRSSSLNSERIDHIYQDPHEEMPRFVLHYGDLTDSTNIFRIISKVGPSEIYNLGAQSHVQVSFDTPEYTANADAVGVTRILEAIRVLGMEKTTKFYQASTSEMFGISLGAVLNEQSPFYPRSPYGVAKLYAYWMTINYREAYGMFAANGILFNHESPRRGETFVTKKVVQSAVRIKNGSKDVLYLGNLDAVRDWGHAKDYVDAMWRIMQYEIPTEWVIATGSAITVRQFVELVFAKLDIKINWKGKGVNEVGLDSHGRILVKIDPRYFRPTEVPHLLGDPSKAQQLLNWSPKYDLNSLVEDMVNSELHAK